MDDRLRCCLAGGKAAGQYSVDGFFRVFLAVAASFAVSLIAGIAWIGGRPLDKKAATEFLTALGMNVGAAFAFREGARALVKFVFPGAGSVISSAVAFSGTMAVGTAAKYYFLRNASIEEAQRAFRNAKQEQEHDDR